MMVRLLKIKLFTSSPCGQSICIYIIWYIYIVSYVYIAFYTYVYMGFDICICSVCYTYILDVPLLVVFLVKY